MIFVRVQPPSTGQTLKDLRAAMGERLAGILVPKVQSPADIHAADALLNCMEVDLGLPMGATMIYPILETAPALRLAYEIAIASPRVSYMGGAISRFGDIHQAVGYRWTPEGRETLFIRSKVLLDAKAAGIRYPISGMWGGDLDDEQGLRAWCKELRDLGYYGMMIGNPRLVPIVHEHFTPSSTGDCLLEGSRPPGRGGGEKRLRPDHLRRPKPRRGPSRAHRARRLRAQKPGLGQRVGRGLRIASGPYLFSLSRFVS